MNAELKRLITNLGELAKIAEDADAMGLLAQVEAETNARVAKARKTAEEMEAKADKALAAATAKAGQIVSDAQAKADQMIRDSATKADEQYAANVAALKDQIDASQQRLASLESDLATAMKALQEVNETRIAAEQATADAQKKLDQAKAKVKALME